MYDDDYDAYDEMMEEEVCSVCGREGMEPDGSYEYRCPNCGARGFLLDD